MREAVMDRKDAGKLTRRIVEFRKRFQRAHYCFPGRWIDFSLGPSL